MKISPMFAQEINIQPPGEFGSLENVTASSIVSASIQLLLVITAIILIFVLLIGGVMVIMSGGGDSQQQARGRQAVTAAIIGLLIVFGAWAILALVDTFFGVNILQLNLPTFFS